eukprot:scaffold4170_cov63-Phaeocystis_antarctica.AAC.19
MVAVGLKGSNRPLSCPASVGLGQRLAALGAAARVEAVPALDAVAVALVALVHLVLGQCHAHGTYQGICHRSLYSFSATCHTMLQQSTQLG